MADIFTRWGSYVVK